MAHQPELFSPRPLTVAAPNGSREPRLWVRRLVIWREPPSDKIRDIELRPGFNVIWSPDGADGEGREEATIGHGAGKTLLCRLLRYCLGENRFASEVQREQIAMALPNAVVGAEIILDGTCWAVVRPLGIRRRHIAVPDAILDEVIASDQSGTGIEPLISAIDTAIITSEVRTLIKPSGGQIWPIALAWLTRDQECRFDDILDWRSPASESDAPLPASGREKGPRLEVLRALLAALTPEEQRAKESEAKLEEQRRRLDHEAAHQAWETNRIREKLIPSLDLGSGTLPDFPLLLDMMRARAAERLVEAAQAPLGKGTELDALRGLYDAARAELERLRRERVRLETAIPLQEQVLRDLRGETPGLSFQTFTAENPVCPICDVPIDRALAEGCKLSHKLPNAAECRQRMEALQAATEKQQIEIAGLKRDQDTIAYDLVSAEQAAALAKQRLDAHQAARDARESKWYAARRQQDEVDRLADLLGATEDIRNSVVEVEKKILAEKAAIGAQQKEQARVFVEMGEKFHPIVRRLIGRGVTGSIALSGRGIEPHIEMGGDRKTAAIDSLKVIAFDLAALCLSIEGKSRVPAFLIHDSPREADLGLSIYHQLFGLARDLEDATEQPLFQYILTTTTRPPTELGRQPWLRETLHGEPADRRLLKCDL